VNDALAILQHAEGLGRRHHGLAAAGRQLRHDATASAGDGLVERVEQLILMRAENRIAAIALSCMIISANPGARQRRVSHFVEHVDYAASVLRAARARSKASNSSSLK
jgi:hypothetical protein